MLVRELVTRLVLGVAREQDCCRRQSTWPACRGRRPRGRRDGIGPGSGRAKSGLPSWRGRRREGYKCWSAVLERWIKRDATLRGGFGDHFGGAGTLRQI
jgi:hypothetical protein